MQKPKLFSPKRTSGTKKFNGAKHREDQYKTTRWVRYRFRFLHHNPKCYACTNKAGHVDHIVPARIDPEGFWKQGNHVALCHSCHSTVTAKFDRKDPPDTQGKVKWLQEQRSLMQLKHPIKVISIDE